jgi:hypothetical protein
LTISMCHCLQLSFMQDIVWKLVGIQRKSNLLTFGSDIPVNENSLIYATPGGKSAAKDDLEVKDIMRNVGSLLNLKPHKVGEQQIYTNADVQVYKEDDNNRLYIINCARLWPQFPPN